MPVTRSAEKKRRAEAGNRASEPEAMILSGDTTARPTTSESAPETDTSTAIETRSVTHKGNTLPAATIESIPTVEQSLPQPTSPKPHTSYARSRSSNSNAPSVSSRTSSRQSNRSQNALKIARIKEEQLRKEREIIDKIARKNEEKMRKKREVIDRIARSNEEKMRNEREVIDKIAQTNEEELLIEREISNEQLRIEREIAAARIAAIEAQGDDVVDDEEDAEISEDESSQRVDRWLHHSGTQLGKNEVNNPRATNQRKLRPEDCKQYGDNVNYSLPAMDNNGRRVITTVNTQQQITEKAPLTVTPPTSGDVPLRDTYQPMLHGQPLSTIVSAPGTNSPEGRQTIVVTHKTDVTEISAAVAAAVKTSLKHTSRYIDLPSFNGSHREWILFKAAYDESAETLSELENIARLRRCLQGRAKEAVENKLMYRANPQEIMNELERRFGRPDSIASSELERLKNLPRPSDTPKDICIFASKVSNVVTALKALKRTRRLYDTTIVEITVQKLPRTVRDRWYKYNYEEKEDIPDLLKLSKFLDIEANMYSLYAEPEFIPRDESQTKQQRRDRTFTTTTNKKTGRCKACGDSSHTITECEKFKAANTKQRWEIVKVKKLCFRCLRYKSKSHHCRAVKCDIDECRFVHHHMLHTKKENTETEQDERVTTTLTHSRNTQAYLKIAPVRITGPAGEVDTWALLDDGSTVTLIDDALATQIGAKGPVEPLNIEAIAETKIPSTQSRRVSFSIQGCTKRHKIHARTMQDLKFSSQIVREEDLNQCKHLRDLRDQLTSGNSAPRLLIGQDNWHLLIAEEIRKGRLNQPIASRTELGWVLHGSHTRTLGQRVNFVNHLTMEDNMNEQLKQFFAIENLTIEPKAPKGDPEERALSILRKHTQQLPDGRYETALLWKTENPRMPENYDSALKRLKSIEVKLTKNPTLSEKYEQEMTALIEKSYAEPAPAEKTPGKTWYLPHFAVLNAMKPDKVRIVHDAAAVTKGSSLNKHLLTGPDLLQSLPGVLMRFRQHQVAVSADIAEMFMQVKVRAEDRDALRYLWRDKNSKALTEYRMTSLIFGATCSPSTAIFVKNTNAERYAETNPEAASAIIKNHYVDDYLGSYANKEDAIRIATQVRDIHKKGHFELRKWSSNYEEVLAALTDASRPTTSIKLTDNSNNERVLGLVWNPQNDKLSFNLDLARIQPELLQSVAPTKREALKIVMSLYDPLGLASPVTVRAKQILQELWRRGTDWDQRLDGDLASQWSAWLGHLQNLRSTGIPRCYAGYSDAKDLQLHVFVDASESAYSAALYWRTISHDERVETSLITAKARVAPLKLTSIPRLELQAAVMGSRMAAAVIEEHDRKPDRKFFWTDSKTVITWLKSGSRTYKPFVAHRIAAIEEHSTVNEWRWIPTKLNVADDATRDVPDNFNSNHRWFVGPDFLRGEESTWPAEIPTFPAVTGEEKCTYTRRKESCSISECVPDISRFSKWEKLLRSTARVIQFIQLCRPDKQRIHYKRNKRNKEDDPEWGKQESNKKTKDKKAKEKETTHYKKIDAALLHRAEELIIRASQQDSFEDEINALKQNRAVARDSRLHSLSVRYENGIIRLNSRIDKISDTVNIQKSPAVVDGNHNSIKLWIEFTHRQMLHAGTETTINECRQHYWVIRLRPVTRMIIRQCIPCRIRRDTPPKPATGNHPSCRLAHHCRPFTYTGVDYFGPLTTTSGRATFKRYVAIFTCLTTRAIHLEMATSLSTNSAVMALRRMVNRRGCPTEIWSDNGTNLRGTDRELRRAMDNATQEEAEKRMINWRYIPPGAPFMGGAWERLVRSVKTALAATQQNRHPTDEILHTLLTEAEYTVNSRPLTHVSVSPDDSEALTPNHFLLGGSARVPTPGTFCKDDLISRAHWRASQHLANLFWARWLREYLPELQHRREPHSQGPALQVGDVVIIADNTLPRNTWPRGIITATFPGSDGIVRAVDVRTRGGTLRRPTKKLVVIPTRPPSNHTATPHGRCTAGEMFGTAEKQTRDGKLSLDK